jgi:hypothetical protein
LNHESVVIHGRRKSLHLLMCEVRARLRLALRCLNTVARIADNRLSERASAKTIRSTPNAFSMVGAPTPASFITRTVIGRPKALDASKAALAQRMHVSGESANTIAQTLGVSRATVYRVLAEVNDGTESTDICRSVPMRLHAVQQVGDAVGYVISHQAHSFDALDSTFGRLVGVPVLETRTGDGLDMGFAP